MDPLDGTTGPVQIGLVGTSVDAIPDLRAIGAERGVEFLDGEGGDRNDPSLVICAGRNGLRTVASRGIQAPVLAVDLAREAESMTAAPGVEWDAERASRLGITRDEVADAVKSLFRRGGRTRRVQTLTVEPDATVESDATVDRAAFDVALVTDEPGTIATFAVTSAGNPVTEVRADGLVVATPEGSRGFARATGGPLLAPGLTAVTVVAASPFAFDDAPWVGPPDGLELSIANDGPAAELQCDGRAGRTIPPGSTASVEPGPALSVVRPNEAADSD